MNAPDIFPRVVIMGAVLLAGFCVTGCHPANLLDEEVEARTSFGFVMWRGHMAKKQTRQQRQELDDAIQELSFGVMTYTNATGSDPIDGAVRAEINGSTLRGLLLKGYEAKRLRIGREKAHLAYDVEETSRIWSHLEKSDSAVYLAQARQRQIDRLKEITADLEFINKRLDELEGSPDINANQQKI
jgi:hypothetical protein